MVENCADEHLSLLLHRWNPSNAPILLRMHVSRIPSQNRIHHSGHRAVEGRRDAGGDADEAECGQHVAVPQPARPPQAGHDAGAEVDRRPLAAQAVPCAQVERGDEHAAEALGEERDALPLGSGGEKSAKYTFTGEIS